MNIPEILAPAGDLTKLKYAVQYGADAIYLGGEEFSLRTASSNFSNEDLKRGIDYAHKNNVKIYVAANIIAKNEDLEGMSKLAQLIYSEGADAAIVADLGGFSAMQNAAPNLPLHVSTQANTLNYESAKMWYKLGAKRVVLSRELSYKDMKLIRENTPSDLELEAFVHGAMCISYSGRCLLSNYMTERDSNQGNCAQSCRWKYSLVEEKRPGEYFNVYETERGSFFFNSKDLCLIGRIPQLVSAGVTSFKIEGRVKSEYYVAVAVKAYKTELYKYLDNPDKYVFDNKNYLELCKTSHRDFYVGFFDGKPLKDAQIYTNNSYIRDYDIVGVVEDWKDGFVYVEQRNKFLQGDEIEILTPDGDNITFTNDYMENENGEEILSAPHAQMKLKIKLKNKVVKNSFLRKKRENSYVDNTPKGEKSCYDCNN